MLQKEDFWAAEDPITYLFRKSYAEVIKYGKSGSYNNAYKQEKIPKPRQLTTLLARVALIMIVLLKR